MSLSNKNRVVLHDLFMSAFIWQLAWLIRFNFDLSYTDWAICLKTMPMVVCIQGVISWRYNLYRGIWRFASIPDLWNILRAVMLGALTIALTLFIVFRLEGVPRTVFVLYPVLLLLGLGGPRLGYRLWKDKNMVLKAVAERQAVLIIGAGNAAELLLREMLRDEHYLPLGLVDDNNNLHHAEIHGIRVLGGIDDLAGITARCRPDLLMIAIPSATGEQMRRIIEHCEQTGVPAQTLPAVSDLAAAKGYLTALRKISIDDLLGRDRVELDWQLIRRGLCGRVILVSGGGGSIGSELCRQLQTLAPARLIIFERNEFNLYRIQKHLEQAAYTAPVDYVLGDVCDSRQVAMALRKYKPHIIFHAAAYKHVTLLESQLREAVRNNVIGTQLLATEAGANQVEKFVLISTDKAVNPGNNLGKTKRIAEILCELRNNPSGTRFITVRFGNVLGSEGSVVPLFQEQINRGGPVTVTSPDMSRYFMAISESCQLIMQASVMGNGGEIYVLDMGEPVKITYLAERMIRLSGLRPHEDIAIEYTGLRAGERLHEQLYHAFERQEKTQHEKIRLARHNAGAFDRLQTQIDQLIDDYQHCDHDVLMRLVSELAQAQLTDQLAGQAMDNNRNIIRLNAPGQA